MNFTHDSTEALEGVLWSCRGPWLTLRDATAIKAGEASVKLLGEAVVERSKVAYLQVLP